MKTLKLVYLAIILMLPCFLIGADAAQEMVCVTIDSPAPIPKGHRKISLVLNFPCPFSGFFKTIFHAVFDRNVNQLRYGLQDTIYTLKDRDSDGRTALHWATMLGYPEIVKELLQWADTDDLEALDAFGKIPERYALLFGHHIDDPYCQIFLMLWDAWDYCPESNSDM